MQGQSRLRRVTMVVAAAAALVGLAACQNPAAPEPTPTVTPSPTPTGPAEDEISQFTHDGTFQSHINVDGMDFVYTLYPTKATPRTNEWFPQGNKYFTVTLTAYDLDRNLRDPFDTKRRVYLDRIEITSTTVSASGQAERPFSLNDRAARVTFDPEPQGDPTYGMLITSPKGAFELRNQAIGSVADDTTEITLTLRANVWIQRTAGRPELDQQEIVQDVPITIFPSNTPTVEEEIPYNAN